MTTAQWLLMFHVTAAFLFVGGSVAAGILNVLAIRAERPSEAATLLRLIRMTLPPIFVGVAGTLVFWAVANALGGIGGRHQERSRELAERRAREGDAPSDELRALLRDPTGTAISYAAGVATLAILVLMIWKPGS